MAKKLTPVQRLMAGMIECALAHGEAQWTNGYRSGNSIAESKLLLKEQAQWGRSAMVEAQFKKLCQCVLREARKNIPSGKASGGPKS